MQTSRISARERGDRFYIPADGERTLEYGLEPEGSVKAAVGFRAVIDGVTANLVSHRMGRFREDPELDMWWRKLLQGKIQLVVRCQKMTLLKTADVFTYDEGDLHAAVSGNASHGYLYCCFWRS